MLGESVAIRGSLDQARALHQPLQSFGELLTLCTAQPHLAHQLLKPRRLVRLARDMPEDGLIGKHSVVGCQLCRSITRVCSKRGRPKISLKLTTDN